MHLKKNRFEFFNFKRSQLDNSTLGLLSQHSSISKQFDLVETLFLKELDAPTSKEFDKGAKIEDIKFEDARALPLIPQSESKCKFL